MSNRSKHLPYYVTLVGCLMMSVGFNFVQYKEIKILKQENVLYKIFFEYLYIKLENLQKDKDFVYK